MKRKKSKIGKWILAAVCGLVLIFTVILIYRYFVKFTDLSASLVEKKNDAVQTSQTSSGCAVEEKSFEVNGDSLSGFIENGAEIKALMNYYACNPVERGDIVLYGYGGNKNPLIKIVKGIPGDSFQLKKTPAGCWNILVNGEISKNYQNEPYCFGDQGYKMLSLYEKDYKGVVPPGAYLIFGNLVGGTKDSSQFGLIGKNDLIGKAIKE